MTRFDPDGSYGYPPAAMPPAARSTVTESGEWPFATNDEMRWLPRRFRRRYANAVNTFYDHQLAGHWAWVADHARADERAAIIEAIAADAALKSPPAAGTLHAAGFRDGQGRRAERDIELVRRRGVSR